ncbi:lipase esterase family [Colletotrichum incanum]|uniref:Lipase esterase family n=1 Tax=Colletotrichum incanum TaxID=1573173 RepID=A0A167BM05_COLIC|nr:lipase esterase family [Colletotrichum incanum]
MLRTIKEIALAFVRPTLDALFFCRHLPWSLRWRLLALQPIDVLTNSFVLIPNLFRRPYTVIHIPVNPERSLRALLFKISGIGPAAETGAIVISLSYRLAPVHPIPAAVDDVDAAIAWLPWHAAEEFGADPTLMKVSGASAGGNLVLAANQRVTSEEFVIRAAVTFYAPVDLRLGPEGKPHPAKFPKKDSIVPLFDAYTAPSKAKDLDNPRMSPFLVSEETLPVRMLLVIAAMDILVQE